MKHNNLPEIRIKDAWLLRQVVSVPLNELWGEGKPLRTDKEYAKIVAGYKDAWQPLEQKILGGMCEILGLTFRQNIIDVYIAPRFHAFSDPMVIGVTYESDKFVDTLTHELLHRLLTDNTKVPSDTRFLAEWKKLFGKSHTFNTLVHIPVHAIHKAIYLDVLNEPRRLKRDVKFVKDYNDTDYIKAWEYVESNDYKEIIKKLKQSYSSLASGVKK